MTTLQDSVVSIAGIGHVYTAPPGTACPDLTGYQFGDGASLPGWTWAGDSSADSLVEFSMDGGDTESKRSWDRLALRTVRGDITTKVTINSINSGAETMRLAFPGSTYDQSKKAHGLKIGDDIERALLIVVVDGKYVSGFHFPRTTVSGTLPTLATDAFTSFPLTFTVLDPNDGKASITYMEPRTTTFYVTASGSPTITGVSPASARGGETVVVTGTNFVGVTDVKVGGKSTSSIYLESSTKMHVLIPAGNAGDAKIQVINSRGKSGEQAFTRK